VHEAIEIDVQNYFGGQYRINLQTNNPADRYPDIIGAC
jgi:hypothetical protein